jgi:phosphoglycolate phosphatase-like HAD superfamily hydrolase
MKKSIEDLYLQLTGIDRGRKIRIIQEKVIGRPFEEGEFEERWNLFKRLGRQSMIKAPLSRGAEAVLSELGRRGVTRISLSNTPVAELRDILTSKGLHAHLDHIRGGGDWPKSESLVRLLREFEMDKDRCIFFGDGKGDLLAARAAGVAFVAIDPGRGEFEGESGFEGPYRDIGEWGEKELGLKLS